jgi:rubrerythrin
MTEMFNADEILQIAVTIEENAQAFYTQASKRVSDEEAKKIFAELAAWEVGHIAIFSKMRARFAEADAGIAFADPDGEAASYLQAIADGKIFDIRKAPVELANLPDSPLEIIQMAIAKEKDAVIFYLSLQEMVPETLGRDEVKSIVTEEISHVRFLSEKATQFKS